MANEKYALLDTDFVSKLYNTRKDNENRMMDRILELPGFCFLCHKQIEIELSRHNSTEPVWLINKIREGRIREYSDTMLISELWLDAEWQCKRL